MRNSTISFFTTNLCNRLCANCIVRKALSDGTQEPYHLSLGEIDKFLTVSEQSGYSFDVILSGGEPTLWTHLDEGVTLFRKSAVCISLCIFSNLINMESLTENLMEKIDFLRVSDYISNRENIKTFRRRHSKKIRVVDRRLFYKTPTSPMTGTLPAICLNPNHPMYYVGKIYACSHSCALSQGIDVDFDVCVDVEPGFLEKTDEIFDRQLHSDICACCISNKKIRQVVKRIKNVSRNSH